VKPEQRQSPSPSFASQLKQPSVNPAGTVVIF
jgi:hypothetical protein